MTSDQTEALNALDTLPTHLLTTPHSQLRMTSINELHATATSHDSQAPIIPPAARDHEEAAVAVVKAAADEKTSSADQQEEDEINQQQQQQAAVARRDVFLLAGIRKLIKSFRSLSHIFEMYKDVDEEEEGAMDIEIGFPTDVQHVAHISLDGSSNVASLRGLEGAREVLSLSANLSLEQFEFAMASLAAHEECSAVLDRVSPR